MLNQKHPPWMLASANAGRSQIGFNTSPKPKVDRNALDAEATERQIRNLYKLADAYGVSGAAALIMEARVKAESAAISSSSSMSILLSATTTGLSASPAP